MPGMITGVEPVTVLGVIACGVSSVESLSRHYFLCYSCIMRSSICSARVGGQAAMKSEWSVLRHSVS